MNFWMLYDAAFLMAGLYGLSLCVKVNLSKDLDDIRLLMPRNVKIEACRDAAGFVRRILPWMLLFSASIILNGAVSLAEDVGLRIPHGVSAAMFALCCGAAAAFFLFQRKAVGEFWEAEDGESNEK